MKHNDTHGLFPELVTLTEEQRSGRQATHYTAGRSVAERLNDYEGFVEKFKPKKTTDDCYTPPLVYEAVRAFVFEELSLPQGTQVIRPFKPEGDYKAEEYPQGAVVIDNPPFSILSQIVDYYIYKGVPFFLFAPHLTLFSSGHRPALSYVVADASIKYENGAVVKTSFVTNMIGDTRIWLSGKLREAVEQAVKETARQTAKPKLPAIEYPEGVVTSARLGKTLHSQIDFRVKADECQYLRDLDGLKAYKKQPYGGAFLISRERAERERAERERAERERAERERAEREKIHTTLSHAEQEIQRRLGKDN